MSDAFWGNLRMPEFDPEEPLGMTLIDRPLPFRLLALLYGDRRGSFESKQCWQARTERDADRLKSSDFDPAGLAVPPALLQIQTA